MVDKLSEQSGALLPGHLAGLAGVLQLSAMVEELERQSGALLPGHPAGLAGVLQLVVS